MMAAVLNHLWQSTLCLFAVAALTLLLRRNGAHSRFWLWFAASAKFLVPFALLLTLGQQLAPHEALPDRAGPVTVIPEALNAQRLAVPFKEAASIQATATIPWDEIVIVVWGLGVCGLLLNWALQRLRQIRRLRPVRAHVLCPRRPGKQSLLLRPDG